MNLFLISCLLLAVPGITPATQSTPSPLPTVASSDKRTAEELIQKARALYDKNKHGEALVLFKRAAEADEKSYDAHCGMGFCYYKLGQMDNAIESFKKAAAIEPGISSIYNYLGKCYIAREQWDLAIIEYNKAIKDNPKNAIAHFDLGSVYFMKEQFAKSKEHYDAAAKIFGYNTPEGMESLRNALKIEMLMERMGK